MSNGYHTEHYTPEEKTILDRYFTNTDKPVFVLKNLPEVVKGALFARYSRTDKSLRRLFLDEFHDDSEKAIEVISEAGGIDIDRATRLYDKVFSDYGDDSVAQLGGCHMACEQVSNIMTKVIERGRFASYLEQSTRYIYYDTKLGENYRYHLPKELNDHPALKKQVKAYMDYAFGCYQSLMAPLSSHYEAKNPKDEETPMGAWKSAIRAKVCDDLRGMLPAATLSNLGMYGSGQAYENLILRMQAHPLAEVRDYSDMMLEEARKVIPSFLKRVDIENRGVQSTNYLRKIRANTEALLKNNDRKKEEKPSPYVKMVQFTPFAEQKVAESIIFTHGGCSMEEAADIAYSMYPKDMDELFDTYLGNRKNRRHKPGRPFENVNFTFEIVSDYGVFRDLQRHRPLTIDWQRLTPYLGYYTPSSMVEMESRKDNQWDHLMALSICLYEDIKKVLGSDVAQYIVPLAFNIRFYMKMNAREAYHMIELRTGMGGHESYRRICHEIHGLIKNSGCRRIARGMNHVEFTTKELGRIDSEKRNHAKKLA